MSPLQVFVARWNASSPPLPYVPVINEPVDTNDLPSRWGSAVPEVDSHADVTMGSNPWVEETGHLTVALVVRSGKGSGLLDDAQTWLIETFHGWRTADNDLRFTQVVGPLDPDAAADGEWWRLAFVVHYTAQARRAQPV